MGRVAVRFAAMLLAASVLGTVSFDTPSAQTPGTTTALTGARVIEGTGRAALENATLLVTNGRVQEVGTAVKVPSGATRVDLKGKTIVPGLINSHGHVDAARNSAEPVRDQLLAQLRMYAL